MATTIEVPPGWPEGIPARSGLPPRNSITRVLDAQGMFCASARKHTQYVQLARGHSEAITDSDIGTSSKEQIRFRVPAWTELLRWGVISVGDDTDAVAYCKRIEVDGSASAEAAYHEIAAMGGGGSTLNFGELSTSDATTSYTEVDAHIDAVTAYDGEWHEVTLELYCEDAEIQGLVIEAIRLPAVTV